MANLYEKINKEIKVSINKCLICKMHTDHCDYGCPKSDITEETVYMILKEIIINDADVIYRCLYDEKYYNVKTKQIKE